jgi:hypothetical protein
MREKYDFHRVERRSGEKSLDQDLFKTQQNLLKELVRWTRGMKQSRTAPKFLVYTNR